jgi:DNA-binding winged helix-turn-helix (wHTH) protein/Tol biopolymer transport system component
MSETKIRFFEFGEFRLDAHRRILQKNGEAVHLTPRSFDLLCVMVENAGRVLEHDELLDKVWEGTFVEQGNLKKTISALRQALGESPEASEFITTVPRKGYRFTAPVRPLAGETFLIRETKAEIIVEEEIDEPAPAIAPALPVHKKKLFRKPLTLGAVAVVLLILAASVFSIRYFSARAGNNFSVERVRQTRAFSAENMSGGILSGNGNFFAYTVAEKGKTGLRVKYTATGSIVEIVQPINASFWFPTFTPDGNYIYFYLANRDQPSKSGVYRVPTLGGVLQLVSEKNYSGLKFSPDGKRLAAFRTFTEEGKERQELLTVDPDGNDERQIAVLPVYTLFRGIAWSPDGLALGYGARKQTPFEKGISYVAEIPLAGGAEKIILPEQEALVYVEEWLSDKKSLLLREREPNSEIYQIWQYFPGSGEKRRVTNDDYTYGGVTVTADGKTLGAIRSFALTSVWTADSGKYDFRQIAAHGGYYYSLGWTADNRLVFSTMENAREFIGIMNADGTNMRLLTEGVDGIRPFPEVSADGNGVVFMSERTNGRQVWNMDLDGRNLKKMTNVAGIGKARLLSDGQTLIFTQYLSSAWFLMKQTADGQTVQISRGDTFDWDISPDEKYLAIYEQDEETKKDRLVVRELAGGAFVKSFEAGDLASLHWIPNTEALSFLRTDNDLEEIVRQPLDGAPAQVLTTLRGEEIRNFCWSRDGKTIAVVRSKAQNEAILIQAGAGR